MITKEREYELIEMAQAGDTASRDELLNAHKNFIHLQAIRLQGYYKGHDLEDLTQQIWLEMTVAVRKFNLDSGLRFLTYAGFFVTKAMNVLFESNYAVRYPRSANLKERHYGLAVPSLMIDVSNDRPLTPIHTLSCLIEFEEIDTKDALEKMQVCLETLDQRDQFIMLYRAAGHTLDATGKQLGITKERVRQLEVRSKAELRRLFSQLL